MKKLLGIVVLGLLWCNVVFAHCSKGNCINGYGTFTFESGEFDGDEYVGGFKEGLAPGDPRRVTVGYNLTRPCIIESECIEKPKKGKGPKQTGFKVKLTPWLPLSKTDPIAVPCDWVVTIAAPVDNLREMYKEDVGMTENGLVSINPNQKLPSVSTQQQSPPLEEKTYDALSNIETVQKEALREEAAKELGTDIETIEAMEKNGQDN